MLQELDLLLALDFFLEGASLEVLGDVAHVVAHGFLVAEDLGSKGALLALTLLVGSPVLVS